MKAGVLDPVSLEIVWTRLVSIVDEAATTFVRTSFSTLVREANDFAVVLTDADGRSLAQSSLSIPSFIGTLPATVKHVIREAPLDSMRPGDAFVTNDPWMGTGHLHDVTTVMPLFRDDQVIAFAAVTSHVPDIGGRLRNSGIREIFEEGLQIPIVRLVREGQPDEAVVAFIRRNVRVPDATMGDIWGQVAAGRMLETRLNQLLNDVGIALDDIGNAICGQSEAAMREAIRALPDGTYGYRIEHDGFEELVVIQCTVHVRDDEIEIDFAGSSPQLPRSVNVVPIYAFAYTSFGVKALLSPDVPNNEGSFVPIRTTAPLGSILNPTYPAASGARSLVGHLLPVAFMGALAEVLPDRVWAPGAANSSFTLSGENGGRRYATVSFLNGGQGGSSERDGLRALSFPSNLANTPLEVIEAEAPLRVAYREVRRGSGGAGTRRGGDGLRFAFTYTGDASAMCSFLITRFRVAAPGLFGGDAGALATLQLNGRTIDPAEHWVLNPGDYVEIETAGGGGYGASTAAREA